MVVSAHAPAHTSTTGVAEQIVNGLTRELYEAMLPGVPSAFSLLPVHPARADEHAEGQTAFA